MIGANGKQASISEHGVGRLRSFLYVGGQQSLRVWRLRRPEEPEQSEKSQRLRIPRPTSANATAVPITRSVHPPPRHWSPPPPAEAWIDCRLLRLLGPTQTATTPCERNVQTACKKPLRIRNLRFMGKATAPNPTNEYAVEDSLQTTAEPTDHAPTGEHKLRRRKSTSCLKSRSKSSQL